jgi:deoxyribonuclease V
VYEEPGDEPGTTTPLMDPKTKETIGMALRTKQKVKPVFISPGHLITLTEAVELVKSCVLRHRLPEPTRFAHNTVNEYRRRDLGIY